MTILEELFTICSNCNCDMPNDTITDGVCKWCNHGEKPVASVEPPGNHNG